MGGRGIPLLPITDNSGVLPRQPPSAACGTFSTGVPESGCEAPVVPLPRSGYPVRYEGADGSEGRVVRMESSSPRESSPGGAPPQPEALARIMLRPLAGSLPLDFFAFGAGSVLLAATQSHWVPEPQVRQHAAAQHTPSCPWAAGAGRARPARATSATNWTRPSGRRAYGGSCEATGRRGDGTRTAPGRHAEAPTLGVSGRGTGRQRP